MRETSHEEDSQREHDEAEKDVNPEDSPVMPVVRVQVGQGCPTEVILQLVAMEVEREERDEVSNKRLTSMAHDIANGLAFLHQRK